MTEQLFSRYQKVRERFKSLCSPLNVEDYGLQAMANTSPAKWHLAHTSWFYETFLLKPFKKGYQVYHPNFEVLFNSYYNGVGAQFPRAQRHLLSRPTVDEVNAYRRHVDEHMQDFLSTYKQQDLKAITSRLMLGINHEQQHQELFLSDLKYCLFNNPLFPAYQCNKPEREHNTVNDTANWQYYDAGIVTIGVDEKDDCSKEQFAFDNESPGHQVYLGDFSLANRLVTNGEFLSFIRDNGYQRPDLWLADGWTEVKSNNWQAPLYWLKQGNAWFEYTLYGLLPLNLNEPVSHVSAYEADAFARWSKARLPTEFEWERSTNNESDIGQYAESDFLIPQIVQGELDRQRYGVLWQWTSSAYQPYPGFSAASGAIGEYNGKFMCNQLVLRGGSYASPRDHVRSTYRNFYYPGDRWQFGGIRLANTP